MNQNNNQKYAVICRSTGNIRSWHKTELAAEQAWDRSPWGVFIAPIADEEARVRYAPNKWMQNNA